MNEKNPDRRLFRRPLQFSLLSLFLIVLIVTIFLGAWTSHRAELDRQQQEVDRWQRKDVALEEVRWVAVVIENIESQTYLDGFVENSRQLGPSAIATLPALRELRSRKLADAEFLARIDAAIRAVEGTMPSTTP